MRPTCGSGAAMDIAIDEKAGSTCRRRDATHHLTCDIPYISPENCGCITTGPLKETWAGYSLAQNQHIKTKRPIETTPDLVRTSLVRVRSSVRSTPAAPRNPLKIKTCKNVASKLVTVIDGTLRELTCNYDKIRAKSAHAVLDVFPREVSYDSERHIISGIAGRVGSTALSAAYSMPGIIIKNGKPILA